MDVEALQAQIDLSNSIAYDLVSSWVKPSTGSSSTTSISQTISRELEEYAKRPPRLGLGATISQSSLATSREAARLKGKLAGQKRGREETNDTGRATGENSNTRDDEDEGESRSTAISTKKSRVSKRFRKEPATMKAPITPKEKSSEGESQINALSTPTNTTVGAANHTHPTTSSTTVPTSAAGSRPLSSAHQAHLPIASQSPSLLNLHHPPLVQVEDEMSAHPQEEGINSKKKKRRRRRGKRRKNRDGEEGG